MSASVFSTIAIGSAGIFLAGVFSSTSAYAAPPIKCELRLGAWCITNGAYEINRRLAQDSIYDRVWTLQGQFRPESKLVILEPNGCNSGESDTQLLVNFQRDYQWDGKKWDRAQVRLKSNGTCDLSVLFPGHSADPMEWAMPQGFRLIRPCVDKECMGRSLTEISEQILAKYWRNKN